MKCNCQITEALLAVIILVFSFVSWYSQWIIVVAAAILLIHSVSCKSCKSCDMGMAKPARKKRL